MRVIPTGPCRIVAPDPAGVGFTLAHTSLAYRLAVPDHATGPQVAAGDRIIEPRKDDLNAQDYVVTGTETIAGSLDDAQWFIDRPDLAEVVGAGRTAQVRWKADGDVVASVRGGLVRKTRAMTVFHEGGDAYSLHIAWVDGYVGKAMADAIDDRLLGKTASATTLNAFLTRDDAGLGTYIRNPDFWAADLDWTGVSVYCSENTFKGCTVISPEHVVYAAHSAIDGGEVRFLASDGTVVSRTIVDSETIGAPTGGNEDFRIGSLNSALPGTVKVYKVPPADLYRWLTLDGRAVPCVRWDQERRAYVRDAWRVFGLNNLDDDNLTQWLVPTDPQRLAFDHAALGGDSGWPVFMVLDGEPILLSTIIGSAWQGNSTVDLGAEINTVIEADRGYLLDELDLSAYPEV